MITSTEDDRNGQSCPFSAARWTSSSRTAAVDQLVGQLVAGRVHLFPHIGDRSARSSEPAPERGSPCARVGAVNATHYTAAIASDGAALADAPSSGLER